MIAIYFDVKMVHHDAIIINMNTIDNLLDSPLYCGYIETGRILGLCTPFLLFLESCITKFISSYVGFQ